MEIIFIWVFHRTSWMKKKKNQNYVGGRRGQQTTHSKTFRVNSRNPRCSANITQCSRNSATNPWSVYEPMHLHPCEICFFTHSEDVGCYPGNDASEAHGGWDWTAAAAGWGATGGRRCRRWLELVGWQDGSCLEPPGLRHSRLRTRVPPLLHPSTTMKKRGLRGRKCRWIAFTFEWHLYRARLLALVIVCVLCHYCVAHEAIDTTFSHM